MSEEHTARTNQSVSPFRPSKTQILLVVSTVSTILWLFHPEDVDRLIILSLSGMWLTAGVLIGREVYGE